MIWIVLIVVVVAAYSKYKGGNMNANTENYLADSNDSRCVNWA